MSGASFLLLGGLLALNAQVPLTVLTALAALFGSFHGYLNGTGINRFDDGTYVLVRLAATTFVVVAVFASLVIPLHRPWSRIAVRVAGSWIAASGLLMIGGALRGTL